MNTPLTIPKKIDLIWNHTRVCGFNCDRCCVAAVHATRRKISTPDLSQYEAISAQPGEDHFAAAQRVMQQRRTELKYNDKLRVLNHLTGHEVRIDISGGDALITPDGLPLLEACASRLGRANVTLTVTGMHVPDEMLPRIAASIAEFNFTFNAATPADAVICPTGYAELNLKLARKLRKYGVSARAECPLTRQAAQLDHLQRLYARLADDGIETLLIMRQFPVGRGTSSHDEIPSRDEYMRAIAILRTLEARHQGPRIKLQCALRHLEVVAGITSATNNNPCDLGVASFGLMADGTLLASPWAMDQHGRPLGEQWVLGNLAQQPLGTLLASVRAQTFIRRADENHGHCKIFSALYSDRAGPMERIFDNADPLYANGRNTTTIAAE